MKNSLTRGGLAIALGLMTGIGATQILRAQNHDGQDRYNRYDSHGRYDAYSPLAQIDPGTFVLVRTQQRIDTDRRDGRVFTAVVERDVWDDDHRLAVPMIRRGSPAELLVRTARDGDLLLDLDSVTVGGRRYGVAASGQRVEGRGRVENGGNAAQYVGGGAILGTIVGAIAGGGKGAAIGAVAGAATGAALMTQGRHIVVPTGSVLTFRLERALSVDVRDAGFQRGDVHYHP